MRPRSPEALEIALNRYMAGVLSGAVVAGRLVRLAVERHRRDLRAAKKRGLRFNLDRAIRCCVWVEHRCRFSKGEWAGRPFILEGFELFIVAMLFGWEKRSGDSWVLRFRVGYLSMARKNAKSELAAAIGLLALTTSCMADVDEIGAEVYPAATKKDQAAIVWKAMASMVKKSPELRDEVKVFGSRYHMLHESTESICTALAADADTLDGLGPYVAIVDELHAHPTSMVWDVLFSGMGARRESLMLAITTAGARREGICFDVESDAIAALEGIGESDGIADDVFGFIARLDDGDDEFNEAVWPKANPNLGVSVHLDQLRIAAATAKRRPSALNDYRRKRMNLWTEGDTAWMPLDRWDGCDGTVDLDALRGQPCYVALDLSATSDTTAVVAAWPLADSEIAVYPWVFVPAETIQDRVPKERELFVAWIHQGLIEATPGDMIDFEAPWLRVLNLLERYDVQEIIFDRWQHAALVSRAQDLIGDEKVIGFGQGYKDMSPAMKLVETMVGHRKLRHGGHPVLRSQMANVAKREDPAGNIKPDKARSTSRIDSVAAMLMAVSRAQIRTQQPVPQFWRIGDSGVAS